MRIGASCGGRSTFTLPPGVTLAPLGITEPRVGAEVACSDGGAWEGAEHGVIEIQQKRWV